MTLSHLKTITFDRTTQDYEACFDGALVGFFPTRHAAQQALNEHAYALLDAGLIPTASEREQDAAEVAEVPA